ncbi:hypothetical protein IJS77_03745 [bacterium]|nr:hypothetical protein [bacterium]
MKKKLLITLFVLLGLCNPVFCDYLQDDIDLRPAKTVYLPKGTFIKVTNIKEMSSQFLDEGDEVAMMSTFDVYIGETNVIPQKSIFFGTVEKIREPVQGTNAAIIIKMDKFTTPNGMTYDINGYISPNGTDLFIGGERTAPLYYTKMPHYTHWKMNRWKIGASQYCETNTRMYGVHTTIRPGAELLLVLQENFDLLQ